MMRSALIQSLINQLQSWMDQTRQQATEPEEVLKNPPEAQLTDLQRAAGQLPVPLPYSDTVQTALTVAVTRWREQVEAENSLVITAPPSEPLGDILRSILRHWPQVDVELLQPLDTYVRPADPLGIRSQLQETLGQATEETAPQNSDDDQAKLAARRQVVLIPALEECFLRCIQGWRSIEYLQHLVVQDTSRFWVIGCSTWSWAFLDRVCHIGAYLEQLQPLPSMKAEELEAWLEPLIKAVDATAGEVEEQDSGEHTSWGTLAHLSDGMGAIATQLWLRCLGVRQEDLPADEQPNPPQELPLHPRKPVLPSLPSLIPMDRYLLHSLLIHRYLTRSQLALSLGESETVVRSRVQILTREGVIVHQANRLTVNPIHYPRLRSELSNNNFLIGQD